jgi:predicted MFS family arabinose efflux permease
METSPDSHPYPAQVKRTLEYSAMLTVLRQRNFALLWLGGLISMTGNWLLVVALPFYVYERTGSVVATTAIIMVRAVPSILLGSVAGVFVDRWDRRRTMIVTNLLQAGIVLLLLLVRSGDWLWIVYVMAFLETAVSRFFGPAEGALLPRLVGEEHLVAANSLNALNDNIARLGGPALGGALLLWQGLPAVVIVDSASYLVAALLIFLVRSPSTHSDAQVETVDAARSAWVGVWREWLSGIRLVKTNAVVGSLFLVIAVQTLADGTLNALVVPFVDEVLHAEAVVFGWLITAQGIGGLVGGFFVGWLGRAVPASHLLGFGLSIVGTLTLVLVNLPSIPVALMVGALIGPPMMAAMVSQQTLLQTSVPDAYRGRILAAAGTTQSLLRLAGLGLSATLADALGIVPLMNLAGVFWICAGLIALVRLREDRQRG